MSSEPGSSGKPLTTPRPGHADLAGMLKYDTHDARNILERSSARETAAPTVVGSLSKLLLATVGIDVLSHVVAIGPVEVKPASPPRPADRHRIDSSPVRTLDSDAEEAMIAAIDEAKRNRDTLGGVVEVVVHGIPAGIGSHVHWDRRIDGRLAGALMSIQAIKGVEVGQGWTQARVPGSEAHDQIYYRGAWVRDHDRAGGTEGGMTTGQPLRVRAAMKPIATLMRPLDSVDVVSKEPDVAFRERSDVCAVPAAGVVAEQMVAYVVADELQRSFGGDTVDDFRRGFSAYTARLEAF
jgi:chorismate synthase